MPFCSPQNRNNQGFRSLILLMYTFCLLSVEGMIRNRPHDHLREFVMHLTFFISSASAAPDDGYHASPALSAIRPGPRDSCVLLPSFYVPEHRPPDGPPPGKDSLFPPRSRHLVAGSQASDGALADRPSALPRAPGKTGEESPPPGPDQPLVWQESRCGGY